ncbi:MFS transporter [Bradyrhizobium sp. 180]|uniref:MFS transporter n=1 Tax=Bradyrhizobium sp. 180 TaxID=2782650 RepID=UPI001FF8FA6B|nr:MFS transporter [Bradyrhizobium sp. 180]
MALAQEADEISSKPAPVRRFLDAHSMVTTLLCVLFAIMYLDRVNISAAAASLKTSFALTNTEMGLIFSAFSWAYLGSVIVGGWGARKYGSKLTLIVCVMIVGMGTIATGLAGGLVSLFVARLAVGMGEGPAFPAATQAMRNWYPPHRFGYIQGITHSASRLGAALTPPIVAAVVLWSGWRSAFIVCGAAALLWCIAWWVSFRDDPREHPGVTAGKIADLSVSMPDRRARIPFWLITRRMASVTVVMFAYGWTYWVFVSWLPLYFVNQHHTDLKSSALLTSALFFAGLVGNTVGGVVSDRILKSTGRNRKARCSVILVSLLGAASLITPTMLFDDLRLVVPLLAGAMFFLELTIAPMYAIPMDISKEYAGIGSAYVIMGVGLSGIVSPVVFGWLIDLTGNWNVPFATGVGILLAGAAAIPWLRPDVPLSIPADQSAIATTTRQSTTGTR